MDLALAIYLSALDDLKGRLGLADALTPAEHFALVRAAERCAQPFSAANADAAGIPVRAADGVYLWQLTVGASVWLDECAAKWWGDDRRRYNLAFVWASMHARDMAAFAGMDDEATAAKRIRRDLRRCGATPKELARAVDVILGARPPDVSKEETVRTATDWSGIVAHVAGQTGLKAGDLAWAMSAKLLMKTYNDLNRFARALGGEKTTHALDELDRANEDLARLKVKIAEAHHG